MLSLGKKALEGAHLARRQAPAIQAQTASRPLGRAQLRAAPAAGQEQPQEGHPQAQWQQARLLRCPAAAQ